MTDKKAMLSRPSDDSLEAYKQWIIELCRRMGLKDDGSISEENWEESWKRFYHKQDDKPSNE